jgi:hypothetical protein
MPPTRPPYPAELKRQIVELVRAGRYALRFDKMYSLCQSQRCHSVGSGFEYTSTTQDMKYGTLLSNNVYSSAL